MEGLSQARSGLLSGRPHPGLERQRTRLVPPHQPRDRPSPEAAICQFRHRRGRRPEDRIRGYEIAKGEYIPVEDSELEAIAIESTHTIEIESFVPRASIDEVYFDRPYYLVPDDKVAEEPFAVIREAMRSRGMAGIARVVLFGRERILMLEPRGRGLIGTTLHYAYEVRDDKAYFDDIPDVKIAPDMLDLAAHIIDTKKAKFDPSRFEDRYQDAVVELIRAKRAGRPGRRRRRRARAMSSA